MFSHSPAPHISVCIPVFETEAFLAQCLRSAWTQDFADFEIVVVSDKSPGRDENGRNAKKIVKAAQKESDRWRKEHRLPRVLMYFREHKENRGVIEVRRTLMFESHGAYLTQLDSDDELEAGALTALYAVAQSADIVHGTSTAGTFGADDTFTPAAENRYGKIFYGTIEGRDVFRRWLMDGAFTANTWGKLIKRELWQKAYEHIPYTACNMADDVLLFFFIAQYAKSYVGIEPHVYRYRMNSGMSSARKIDSLHKWKMICSTASVFSVISVLMSENPDALTEDEVERVRAMTRYYLANNLKQMRETVVPELQTQARRMLCDFWGESFVERMEKSAEK